MLVGRWLDLYLMIAAPFAGARPQVGLWEAGLIFGAIGLFLLAFLKALGQALPVPVQDPQLAESVRYHN